MTKRKTGRNKKKQLKKLKALEFETPMMQQYLEIKKKHPDCLLLFRLGDFYELFLDDAKIGAEVLGITLTSRSRGRDGKIPMCGIPYHALDSYLGKLVKAGYKAAICEQVESAAEADGMVERQVVRTVTPGTVLDEKNLTQKENNFILGVELDKKELGMAYADLSTGELYIHQIGYDKLEKALAGEILRINPAEVISSHNNYNKAEILRALRVSPNANIYPDDNWEANTRDYNQKLKKHFNVKTLSGFGIKKIKHSLALKAAAALIEYLKDTQKSDLSHIKKINPYWAEDYLRLDSTTVSNLELFYTLRGQKKEGTLIDVLDHTHTAGGGRKLKQWLLQPLTKKEKINKRLDAVEILKNEINKRDNLQEVLSEILDMERLMSRIAVKTANPRDLVGLKSSLQNTLKIADFLQENLLKLEYLFSKNLQKEIKPLIKYLDNKIKPDPPATLNDGGYIAKGVSEKLDHYREILSGSKEWLSNFEKEQRKKTGIEKLKVDQNKVYGFYIQVSKAQTDKVPATYIRKQTLVNSERYITPELKEREEDTLQAEEKIKILEKELFENILQEMTEYAQIVQQTAKKVSKLDVFCSLAEIAQKNRYIRPEILKKGNLEIKEGRHPVIEALEEEAFVPNNTKMNKKSQILLITGPNMAGKSTYLRQVALITLLAQIGSFIPAVGAQIPIRDQIFTRVGASDNISLGQSTFLVEMMETANILNNCTPKSLIIFDEIGRGTSTFDGMSIAWAVVEYLVQKKSKKALTLFATHYHELTQLGKKFPEIKNFQVAVKREKDEIVFLHKVIEGSSWHSYGIEVGKLAGLPDSVVKRAQYILRKTKDVQKTPKTRLNTEETKDQIELFDE